MSVAASREQKALFSASMISPMACSSIFFFLKDVYVLKFAADVGLMGFVGTMLSIMGPAFQPLVGYCLEKVNLEKYFPWDTWGRRAPWFLTHCIGAAFTCAAIFLPPSFDPTFLCFWYLAWALPGSWFLSVVWISIESCRVEVYPTKEERSEVEAGIKVMCGIGVGIGTGLPLIIAAEAPFHVLVLMSAAALISGLVSIVAVPVLRKARVPYDSQHLSSFAGEFMGLLRVPVLWHLIAYRMTEDVLTMTALTASLYYLTFVEGLMGVERSVFMSVCGIIIGASTVVVLPCWTQFFRFRRPGVNINVVCGKVVALGVFAPVALALEDWLPRGLSFAIYICLMQGSLTGQTFWRSIALGWIVDEDCHACQGRRREAIFVGIIAFFSSMGRAVGIGVVLYGLAFCGMDMTNCDLECREQGAAAATDCVKLCDVRNIASQPESVRTYLRMVYVVVVTSFQVIAAALVCSFPICNARLDAIYDKQAEMVASRKPDAAGDLAAEANAAEDGAPSESPPQARGDGQAAVAWSGPSGQDVAEGRDTRPEAGVSGAKRRTITSL